MNRQMRSGGAGFYVLVLAIIGIAMYISSIMTSSTGGQYNVEDFKQDVKAGKVTSVEITPNEETPTGVVRANYENKRSKHFNCTDIKDVEEIIKTDSKLAQNYVINDVDKPSWIIDRIAAVWIWISSVVFAVYLFVRTDRWRSRSKWLEDDGFR